jgi:hypothetical protein
MTNESRKLKTYDIFIIRKFEIQNRRFSEKFSKNFCIEFLEPAEFFKNQHCISFKRKGGE